MTILDFAIAALATWRLSSLIVNEAGPFKVFQRVREAVGIVHDSEGKAVSWPEDFLGDLLSCVWCTSIYIGVGVTLSIALAPLGTWILMPFALSAIAIYLERLNRG